MSLHGPGMQPMRPEPKKHTEGWGVKRPRDQRWHYYRKGMSLCGRVGFYNGPLDADDGKLSASDCRACRKVLDRE